MGYNLCKKYLDFPFYTKLRRLSFVQLFLSQLQQERYDLKRFSREDANALGNYEWQNRLKKTWNEIDGSFKLDEKKQQERESWTSQWERHENEKLSY